MIVKQQFVSAKVAEMLRNAGFDEPCWWAYYNGAQYVQRFDRYSRRNSDLPDGIIAAPTQQFAVEWLRKKKYIYLWVEFNRLHRTYRWYAIPMGEGSKDEYKAERSNSEYEKAIDNGIMFCIKSLIYPPKEE